MKTPIRKQFEEAIRNNIESGYEDFEPYFTGVDKSAEAVQSIADNMAIEFLEWAYNEKYQWHFEKGWKQDYASNDKFYTNKDLLSAFKKEVYGE
jgi:hypothetical protein